MTNEIAVKTYEQGDSAFELKTFAELERFSKIAAESDFVPKDYKGKPGNVMIAVMYGNEIGLLPLQALQSIAVVNGRPIIWGDAALALVRASAACKGVKEWSEGSMKDGTAVYYCEVKRNSEVITGQFSIEQSKKAGLWGNNTWAKYPERMLQLRARGFALRDAFPDVLRGMHIEGEIEDAEYEVIEEKPKAPKKGLELLKSKVIPTVIESKVNITTGEVIEQQPVIENVGLSFKDAKSALEFANTPSELIQASDLVRSIQVTDDEKKELKQIYLDRKKIIDEKK